MGRSGAMMRELPSRLRVTAAGMFLALTVFGCTTAAAPVTEGPDGPTATPLKTLAPVSGEIEAVSKSKPTAEAVDVMAKCSIGEQIVIDKVSGMGKVPTAKDVLHYVPLTGREPQLKEQGPAWMVQIRGDVPQPGGEIWTDPVCVVTAGDHGFYATGTVTNAKTGKVTTPEPPLVPPDRTLPALAP